MRFSGENALFPDVAKIAVAKSREQALNAGNLSLLIFPGKLSGPSRWNISQRHKHFIRAISPQASPDILGVVMFLFI